MWYGNEFDNSSNAGGGGFLNNTTTQTDAPAKKDGVRRLQSVVPVVVRQIKECQEDEFKLFGMSTQILNIVGILRNFEVLSTKATYNIQDHTGEIKAIWWLENDDNSSNLPNVKEGSYVQVYGSLRNQDGEKILMVLRMFPVDDNNLITNHLLQVIHTRLAAEAMQKNSESTIKANNPGAELANSMSFMNDNVTDSGMGGLTALQEKVYKILQTNKTPQGMDRATLLSNFSANQHHQVNEALEFLNNEGHAYSTVDNDHFKVTDA